MSSKAKQTDSRHDEELKESMAKLTEVISDMIKIVAKSQKDNRSILDIPCLDDHIGDRNLYDHHEDEEKIEVTYYTQKRTRIMASLARKLPRETIDFLNELLLSGMIQRN